jgi:hypothetical protein
VSKTLLGAGPAPQSAFKVGAPAQSSSLEMFVEQKAMLRSSPAVLRASKARRPLRLLLLLLLLLGLGAALTWWLVL